MYAVLIKVWLKIGGHNKPFNVTIISKYKSLYRQKSCETCISKMLSCTNWQRDNNSNNNKNNVLIISRRFFYFTHTGT